VYTGMIPPVDSFEYFTWRGQIDGLALRSLIARDWDAHLSHLRYRLSQLSSTDLCRISNHALLDEAARLIRSGQLHVRPNGFGVEFCSYRDAKNSQSEPQRRWGGGGMRKAVGSALDEISQAAASTARPKHANWIEVQIRDQKTGAGISGAVLTLKDPDGRLHTAHTDFAGIARVEEVPGGTAEIVDIKYPDALELRSVA